MESDAENSEGASRALRRSVGLCADCQFRRDQKSQRGSVFYRCARADQDENFMRYPPLPVLRCRGFLAELPGPFFEEPGPSVEEPGPPDEESDSGD